MFKDWDLSTRKVIASGTVGRSFDPRLNGANLSIDGNSIYLDRALTPTGEIAFIQELLDLSTGKSVFSLRSKSPHISLLHPNGTYFEAETISPDGKQLVASFLDSKQGKEQFVLRVWEVDNGRELPPLFVSEVPITGIVFSPRGEKLAVI